MFVARDFARMWCRHAYTSIGDIVRIGVNCIGKFELGKWTFEAYLNDVKVVTVELRELIPSPLRNSKDKMITMYPIISGPSNELHVEVLHCY